MNRIFYIKYYLHHYLSCNETNSEFQYSSLIYITFRGAQYDKIQNNELYAQDFQSKSDLIEGGEEWQKAVLKMQSKFAEAGAI